MCAGNSLRLCAVLSRDNQPLKFIQVVATLALSLNPSCPQHVDLLREIVITVVQRLNNDTQDDVNVAQQTPAHEVCFASSL